MESLVSRSGVNAPKPDAAGGTGSSGASVHLDAIRGVSAILVFLSHWRYIFFAEYEEIHRRSTALKVVYFLTGLGHQAVIVFFVLSGYFITASVMRSVNQGKWSWWRYAEQRLTRLYVVLVPALLIGSLWDRIGISLSAGRGIYAGGGQYYAMIPRPVSDSCGLQTAFGNLFFLQKIFVPTLGSNGPLWSLANEFWYYILFPMLFVVLPGRRSLAGKIIVAIVCLGILYLITPDVAEYFGIWLLGSALAVFPAKALRSSARSLLLYLAWGTFVVTGVISRSHIVHSLYLSDLILACVFSALLSLILSTRNSGRDYHPLYRRLAIACSRFSFSLYLLHVPLLVLMNWAIIRTGERWQPDLNHFAFGVAVIVAVLAYTILIWQLTEANTGKLRQFMTDYVTKKWHWT